MWASTATEPWLSFTDFGGHVYINAVLPGIGIHAMTLRNLAGEQTMVTGAVFAEESENAVVAMTMPDLSDLSGGPHQFVLQTDLADGRTLSFDVEIIHTLPLTMTDANDNINGIAWDLPDDVLLLTGCTARITAEDGIIGYGYVERATRRNRLTQPA